MLGFLKRLLSADTIPEERSVQLLLTRHVNSFMRNPTKHEHVRITRKYGIQCQYTTKAIAVTAPTQPQFKPERAWSTPRLSVTGVVEDVELYKTYMALKASVLHIGADSVTVSIPTGDGPVEWTTRRPRMREACIAALGISTSSSFCTRDAEERERRRMRAREVLQRDYFSERYNGGLEYASKLCENGVSIRSLIDDGWIDATPSLHRKTCLANAAYFKLKLRPLCAAFGYEIERLQVPIETYFADVTRADLREKMHADINRSNYTDLLYIIAEQIIKCPEATQVRVKLEEAEQRYLQTLENVHSEAPTDESQNVWTQIEEVPMYEVPTEEILPEGRASEPQYDVITTRGGL